MSFLDTLNPEDLVVVEKYLQPVRFKKGSCILSQGDPGDGCYLIDEGEVRLELLNTETDSDSVLGYVHPGMFLGEFSLLDGERRSAFAYAHTDIAARWFGRADFETLCQQHPAIGLAISNALGRNLTGKLRTITGQISEYLFADEADANTNEMVARAAAAQRVFEKWSEDQVDELLRDLAETVAGQAEVLAQDCVEETGIGVVQDKIAKINYAALGVYKVVAGKLASGVLQTDEQTRITEIAAPMGVVFGLIPLTNPVSTIIFKTIVCLKGRNALVYSCHHNALKVGNRTGDLIQSVLIRHGAPADLVQWVRERASRRKTAMLMKHKGIAFILATGGPSLVKAAYSSGTPAIGVGAGNAPVLICADADPVSTAQKVVAGKSFDNGVICGSENNLVVEATIHAAFVEGLQTCGAAVITPDEKNRLVAQIFDEQGHLDRAIIGKSAQFIADRAGIRRGYEIRLLVIPSGLDEVDGPLGREKLAPFISLFTVNDFAQGLEICKHILSNEGRGHTAVIHTYNQEWIDRFGQEIEASRILVNISAAQGCIGIGNGLSPSLTLGCGTFGGNSTTDNVTYRHLINVKRLAMNF